MVLFGFDVYETAYVARAYRILVEGARFFNDSVDEANSQERVKLAHHMMWRINSYNHVIPKRVREALIDSDVSKAEAHCRAILEMHKT